MILNRVPPRQNNKSLKRKRAKSSFCISKNNWTEGTSGAVNVVSTISRTYKHERNMAFYDEERSYLVLWQTRLIIANCFLTVTIRPTAYLVFGSTKTIKEVDRTQDLQYLE